MRCGDCGSVTHETADCPYEVTKDAAGNIIRLRESQRVKEDALPDPSEALKLRG